MVIQFAFRGMMWSKPRLLEGAAYAEIAHQQYRRNDALEPLHSGTASLRLRGQQMQNLITVYLHNDTLVATADRRDVMESQTVEEDSPRLYYASENERLLFLPEHEIKDGYPTNTLIGHAAGVPRPEPFFFGDPEDPDTPRYGMTATVQASPEHAPSADKQGNPAFQRPLRSDRRYEQTNFLYTYVNRYGEEGQPSLPSKPIGFYDDISVVSLVARSIDHPDVIGIRVYQRVNRQYYLIGEPLVTYEGTDTTPPITSLTALTEKRDSTQGVLTTIRPEAVLFLLVTEDWTPPPEKVKHLVGLDNGMAALGQDRVIHLCVPNQMHAWPTKYRIPIRGTIIRMVKLDGGFAVLTDRGTQFFSGAHPASMFETGRPFPYPITDPRSLSADESGALYLCAEGVAALGASGGRILTDRFIDRNTWQERVSLDEARTGIYEGQLLVMTRNPVNNQPIGYLINLAIGEITSFEITDAQLAFGFWTDPRTSDVLMAAPNGAGMVIFNAGTAEKVTWVSGLVSVPEALSLCAITVDAENYPVPITVIPEGRPEYTVEVPSPGPHYMQSTGYARRLSVRIDTDDIVTRLALATDIEHL